jgi:hypothetical protein
MVRAAHLREQSAQVVVDRLAIPAWLGRRQGAAKRGAEAGNANGQQAHPSPGSDDGAVPVLQAQYATNCQPQDRDPDDQDEPVASRCVWHKPKDGLGSCENGYDDSETPHLLPQAFRLAASRNMWRSMDKARL